jgi:hypothetical protein
MNPCSVTKQLKYNLTFLLFISFDVFFLIKSKSVIIIRCCVFPYYVYYSTFVIHAKSSSTK